MAATKVEVVDGRRRIRVADVKEILVQWDAGASISGIARYSVPYRYVSHRLDVRLSRSTVEIHSGAELVATYLRRYLGRLTRMEQYPEPDQAFLRASPQACLRQAEATGPATHQLVRELLVDHALHHLRQAQGVLRLVDRDGAERLERACKRALDAGDRRYRTVRGILERGADQVQPDDELRTVLRPIGAFLRSPGISGLKSKSKSRKSHTSSKWARWM